MIKLVNGVPEKLVEMDEQVRFIEQMDEDNSGPVILINKFNVSPGEVDEFLKAFAATGKVLMRQPGYISAQLHRGNAGSCVFLNYVVWESAKQSRQAVTGSKFLSSIVGLSPSTVMSPHLLKKLQFQVYVWTEPLCGNTLYTLHFSVKYTLYTLHFSVKYTLYTLHFTL